MDSKVLKGLGGALVVLSFVLFRFVGIPVTETYGPDGFSQSWSWGHIVVYTVVGLSGAGLLWLGNTADRK